MQLHTLVSASPVRMSSQAILFYTNICTCYIIGVDLIIIIYISSIVALYDRSHTTISYCKTGKLVDQGQIVQLHIAI